LQRREFPIDCLELWVGATQSLETLDGRAFAIDRAGFRICRLAIPVGGQCRNIGCDAGAACSRGHLQRLCVRREHLTGDSDHAGTSVTQ
jgi:hypothetical protein